MINGGWLSAASVMQVAGQIQTHKRTIYFKVHYENIKSNYNKQFFESIELIRDFFMHLKDKVTLLPD